MYWQPGLLTGQSRLHDVVLRSEPSFRTDRANGGSLASKMKEQKLSVQNTAVKSVNPLVMSNNAGLHFITVH